MNASAPTKFLTPMVVILGVTLPAWGQQPSTEFRGFGCRIDLTAVSRVPAEFRAILLATDTFKKCPGNRPVPSPNIQMTCDVLIPGWPSGLKINTKTHACEIDGEQCGLPRIFVSDNTQLLIEPVVINGEVFGAAELRCQNKNNN
jgi:hypothetical protein